MVFPMAAQGIPPLYRCGNGCGRSVPSHGTVCTFCDIAICAQLDAEDRRRTPAGLRRWRRRPAEIYVCIEGGCTQKVTGEHRRCMRHASQLRRSRPRTVGPKPVPVQHGCLEPGCDVIVTREGLRCRKHAAKYRQPQRFKTYEARWPHGQTLLLSNRLREQLGVKE
jgi:hypothetical protein